MMKHTYLLILTLLLSITAFGQATLRGVVTDAETKEPLNAVYIMVKGTKLGTVTNERGEFELKHIPSGKTKLVFKRTQYGTETRELDLADGAEQDLGDIPMKKATVRNVEAIAGTVGDPDASTISPTDSIPPKIEDNTNIPIISLAESELESEDNVENISGLLTAGRDLFTNTAAFGFGVARFRIRGYDNNSTEVYVNGAYMSDLETGRTFWSAWGGLNDVFRNREATQGLNASEIAFGGINGSTNIDIGAKAQRHQTRISYASSNRSYRHRLMGVWTPVLKNGWSLSLSGSRRWAQEGYQEGTFYDAWSYFLGVEKAFSDKQSIAFNFFGAPNKRGRAGAAVQEMYDIAGSNYYNSFWGWQEGKKRNSRVSQNHQPVAVLRHHLNLGKTSKLTTSASFQFGRNGSTALDWNGARDPRPDYYRYLPSWIQDPAASQNLYNAMVADENLRQLDWTYLYNTNWNSAPETIEDADGIAGNTVTGIRSKYVLEERRFDKKKADVNVNYSTSLGDNVVLNAGGYYRWQKTHNHKVLNDLLGGDFYINVDRFAERDFPDNPEALQNDINTPNDVVRVGDTFGYSYYSNINTKGTWAQGQFSTKYFDFFAAANVSHTQFWRTGNYVNGRFPDNSFGDSEKQNFLNYGVKGGVTYKINGRNYIFANGGYMTRPPSYRDAYLSPRTRDQVAPGLTSQRIVSTEGGYFLKSPDYKLRLTGYFTEMYDGVQTISFYHDGEQAFVNYTLNGIDQRHFGLEAAAEINIAAGLSATAVASVGQYYYTSRPTAYITQDNSSETLGGGRTIYQKNFYIPGTPQQAYSAGLRYNSRKFWFANVTFNLFDEMYLAFNPDRRTSIAVDPIDPSSEDWTEAINQERLDMEYTLDLFGGKSFKIKDDYFVYFTVGVSNVLNNRDFITGGFEQRRFDGTDLDKFPSRYYYAYGINYFASVAFRF